MQVSKFTLAPRGYGRSSFRFTETLQIGRLPVYIYDDYAWLPYSSTIADISNYGLSLQSGSAVYSFIQSVKNMTNKEYLKKISKVRELRHLFTYAGVIEQIDFFIKDPLGINNSTSNYLRCTRVPDSEKGWRRRHRR